MDTGKITFSAENSWSDPFSLRGNDPVLGLGQFDLSIWGDFGTVTLQRRFDSSENFRDVENFTVATEKTGEIAKSGEYRIGVKTGNYSANPLYARILQ